MLDSETLSFLENALDREFYVPRKNLVATKPPIRVMVTDAGDKIAYNIIYTICSGKVFGPDQEIILHLNNSKGTVYHRDVAMELFECGFSCYKDFVISSNPAVIYKGLDYVILLTTYEEISGWIPEVSFTYQTLKACEVARCVMSFSKPDCKVILAGPSTKGLVWFLGAFKRFAMKISPSNITSVTCLDQFISKALLAAKLKTTTTSIKNVIIWHCTYPDIYHATVKMVPPDDIGGTKKLDLPLSEVIDDQQWLNGDFRMAVFKRVLSRDLLKYGKAIAVATSHHLKVLYNGTDGFDEIQCMGVISPPGHLYSLPEFRGFSYPVTVKNQQVQVLQEVSIEPLTFLNRLGAIYAIADSCRYNSSLKIVSFLSDYEKCKEQMIAFGSGKLNSVEPYITKPWFNRYFITPSPAETYTSKSIGGSRKSIGWVNAAPIPQRIKIKTNKRSTRISFET